LTLMELVVVLVILAALAMLVIPRLGFIKDQADFALSASGSADVMSNLELFKTQTGMYPGKLDSLIQPGATGDLLSTLWGHGGPPSWLVAEELGSEYSTNFSHSFGSGLMQHAIVTGADPSSSGTVQVSANATAKIARVVGTKYVVAAGFADNSTAGTAASTDPVTGAPIAAVPGTAALPPTGVKLIALGVGPRNTAIGKTMANAPQHAGASPTNYGRYIGIFALYANNPRKAELRAVVDSRGFLIDERISSFRNSTPTAN